MKLISSALVKAQKEFGPALKTSTNPHFRSRYADLSACVEAVIDALNNNGIFLLQKNTEVQGGVSIETVFVHESGESMSCGSLFVPATKQDAQGYGSALTYARRYSLMAACGIAPEDDDGNAAGRRSDVNPLDAIRAKSVSVSPPVPMETPAAIRSENTTVQAPGTYKLNIPGKESILCSSLPEWMETYNTMADKVAGSRLSKDSKATKISEFNSLNADVLKMLSTVEQVAMTAHKQKRKIMLETSE
jgi:hypothetical protein